MFISALFYGLAEANRRVEREIMLEDMMMTYVTVAYSRIAANGMRVGIFTSGDPFYKEHVSLYRRKAQDANEHLEKLLKKMPSLKPLYYAETGAMNVHPTSSPFLQRLQRLSDLQNQATLNSMDSLQHLLLGGMMLGIFVSVLLAVFFCLNITNRLLIIMNNTVALAQGAFPSQPLKGSDEIAELDQFLFKSATEIRELERFKKEMVGVVSHELKSPLSSVTAFLSSLSNGVFGELNSKAKDKAERTLSSAQRLMGLVKELLYLDRLELTICPEKISVEAVIAAAIDTVRELSEQRGVEIFVTSPEGNLLADRDRIIQVIVNLLSNALKFSPPHCKVKVETSFKSGCFECRVSDEGRGIPESYRKQIFEPFKQADATDTIAKKGTGLGLTISRSIVEQHGGEIGVDSVEGKGSTFWFKIPAQAKTVLDSAEANKPAKQQSPPQSGGLGKFGVLAQGMVIIAIPLIFQLTFVSLIGLQIKQVRAQIKLEKDSREVLDLLSRGVDGLLAASQETSLYALTMKPIYKRLWEEKTKLALQFLDRANSLSTHDSARMRDLKNIKNILHRIEAMVEVEAARNKGKEAGLNEMIATMYISGKLSQMTPMSMIGAANSLGGLTSNLSANFDLPSSNLSTLDLLTYFRSKVAELMKISKPVVEAGDILHELIKRETARGEGLSKERSKMIRNLQLMFLAGILLNIGLSILLALTLMRGLSSRLQHVMENTARLVKREPLDPPKRGTDEIAHLDQTLYRTGMHLFELEDFKRKLIAIVSHELRTPLLSISAALELFSTGVFDALSEKGQNRLNFALEECNRLIRLINDLLDIEKMEAGKFVLDKKECKIDDLLSSSTAAVAQLAELKQIKLSTSANAASFCADHDRVCQVLINLLSNAIKFSPEGGSINVTATHKDTFIEFRVSDQGRGIPEGLKQKIFDRFVQVDKKDASEKGGSGLGLAISKAIVEQHGGVIGVESESGQGSSFWFQLPLN